MALVNEAYNTLKNLFQKHDRGFVTPDEFNDACQYVERKMIRESFDFINNIKNNAKIGRVVKVDYDKERFYREITRRLLTFETLSYNSSTGFFELPADYSLCQSIYYGDAEVEEASMDERMINNIAEIAVDEEFPVFFMNSDSVEILPEDITSGVKMYYYKNPTAPKWTYNKVSGKPVFDPDKSDFQDFNLPENVFDEIIVELAKYFSIQIKQPDVSQAMQVEDDKNQQKKRSN